MISTLDVEPVPEAEQRFGRVAWHIRELRPHGVHRRRQLERQPTLGSRPAEENVEHRLVGGTEDCNDRCARFDELWDHRRPLEVENEHHRDRTRELEQRGELGLLEVEVPAWKRDSIIPFVRGSNGVFRRTIATSASPGLSAKLSWARPSA